MSAERNIISLEQVKEKFGDAVVSLEPKSNNPQWIFDLKDGAIRRLDGRFFEGIIVDREAFSQLAIIEEPNKPEGTNFIGQVIVEFDPENGLVRTRKSKGLNGEVLELKPSSLSKGEISEKGKKSGFIEANPQRIGGGYIEIVLIETSFPAEEGMKPERFVEQSTDARSMSALAKAGLLGKSK